MDFTRRKAKKASYQTRFVIQAGSNAQHPPFSAAAGHGMRARVGVGQSGWCHVQRHRLHVRRAQPALLVALRPRLRRHPEHAVAGRQRHGVRARLLPVAAVRAEPLGVPDRQARPCRRRLRQQPPGHPVRKPTASGPCWGNRACTPSSSARCMPIGRWRNWVSRRRSKRTTWAGVSTRASSGARLRCAKARRHGSNATVPTIRRGRTMWCTWTPPSTGC